MWGAGLVLLLLLIGAIFFIRLKFFVPKNFCQIFKTTYKNLADKNGIESLKTLSCALGGALGTGNITGVCAAVAIGGAGSVFWMWICATFGMATAYAENYLAAKYAKKGYSGALCYIKYGVKCNTLSKIFAVFAMFSALGMGCMVQSNTIANAVNSSLDISLVVIGFFTAIFVFAIISGGARRLKNAAIMIVPPLSVFYMAICLIIIALFYKNIPYVLESIFSSAFDFKSVIGGFSGSALSIGLRRGAFSNEAGLGSSPFFHSASDNKNPHYLGSLASFEVFVDTIICCTLTAFAVLCSNSQNNIVSAFSYIFGDNSAIIYALTIMLFAFATMLGWSMCGEICAQYLFGQKCTKTFRLIFAASAFLGAITSADFVWTLSDIINGLMAYPNLFALFYLQSQIKSDTE